MCVWTKICTWSIENLANVSFQSKITASPSSDNISVRFPHRLILASRWRHSWNLFHWAYAIHLQKTGRCVTRAGRAARSTRTQSQTFLHLCGRFWQSSHQCDRMWSSEVLWCVCSASVGPSLPIPRPNHNNPNGLWWAPPSCLSNWWKFCAFEPAVLPIISACPSLCFVFVQCGSEVRLTEWSLEWQSLLEEQLVWNRIRIPERDPPCPLHLDHITWHDLRTDTTSALQHGMPQRAQWHFQKGSPSPVTALPWHHSVRLAWMHSVILRRATVSGYWHCRVYKPWHFPAVFSATEHPAALLRVRDVAAND